MKLKLNKEQQEEMQEAAEYLIDAFYKDAKKAAELVQGNPASIILSTLRPFLVTALDPSKKAAYLDSREREWKYKFFIYDMTQGQVGAPLWRESKVKMGRGLNAVIKNLRSFLKHHHEKADFNPDHCQHTTNTFLKKRFGGMRPAISKGGGRAETSIPYVVDDDHYMVFVRLCYAELELDNRDSSQQ